jgi:hypothetical protein
MPEATHNDLQRSLGRVEATQSALEARMDRFEKLVTEGFDKIDEGLERIDKRLTALEAKESERKGAWGVIVTVSGVVGGLAAALVKYLFH